MFVYSDHAELFWASFCHGSKQLNRREKISQWLGNAAAPIPLKTIGESLWLFIFRECNSVRVTETGERENTKDFNEYRRSSSRGRKFIVAGRPGDGFEKGKQEKQAESVRQDGSFLTSFMGIYFLFLSIFCFNIINK